MNPKIELQRKLKAKLGVTITPNMNVKQLSEAWSKITPEIKATLPPSLETMFTTASSSVSTLETLGSASTQASSAYSAVQEAIESGVAVIAGQPQQPVLLAANKAAEEAAANQAEVVSTMSNSIFNNLALLV